MYQINNLTPRAQQALSLAAKEASNRNHSYVGTEHLVLGVLKLGNASVASEVLDTLAGPDVYGRFVAAMTGIHGWPQSESKAPMTKMTAPAPWPDPPEEKAYLHYLLLDDSVGVSIAIVSEPEDTIHNGGTPNAQPIDIARELEGPFLSNLFARLRAFPNRLYGNTHWEGWSISAAEYARLLRMSALVTSAREFNRLREHSV